MQRTTTAPAHPTASRATPALARPLAPARIVARALLRAFDCLNRTHTLHADLHPADWATAQRLIDT